MEKEMNITFEGVKLEIRKMERPELKGIYAKDILGFDFYEAKYKDYEFLLLVPQKYWKMNLLLHESVSTLCQLLL